MAVSAYPEVKSIPITGDLDFLICACDGIWDCMSSQQAVDFVLMAKEKQSNYTPQKAAAAGASPTKTGSKMRAGKSPPRKSSTKNKTEAKLEDSINKSKFTGLATTIEMMMDINCPANLHVTDGLGADNMTAIIVEFKK